MEKKTSNGNGSVKKTAATPKTTKSNQSPSNDSIQESQLQKLFEDELKDIYWAEKALTKAIPKMIKNATSGDLIKALESHLDETQNHVTRLEQVFELIGKNAVAKKCEATAGLILEAGEIMEECDKGAMRDAGIISAAQKVEHYEIATYGTLRQFADTLGLDKVVKLLAATLSEEKAADEKLTEVAENTINIEAAHQEA
ncbi:ferritin-like domain-containing protein [Cytophaga aurantiaca]|uniref:YciE/YciF ferroxidase family protein n=1 Tax=Cytophaga aurantiaca TaxID=29530 RepID=UPI000361941D|nr:ferritin-like domain-containing protein [Cytophaga aurantiaca]